MVESRKVHDTSGVGSKRAMLMEALTGGQDGMIERQEVRGQASFVLSTQLPIEGSDDPAFEAMGIKFGDPTDTLFREAELPDGWKKQATDHSMWSIIVDENGVERAAIFYKAAFYDRRAHIRPTNP